PSLLCMLALLRPVAGADPWHTDLSFSGGGWWPVRVPVVVQAPPGTALSGRMVSVRVGRQPGGVDLAGLAARTLRVCRADGAEYLFDVEPARRGDQRLREGDVLSFCVDAPAGGRARYYIYGGNPSALEPGDWLGAALVNGSFEEGATGPVGWAASLTDADHEALYDPAGGREGSACVAHRVRDGAPATWVQWSQSGLRAAPGERWRLRGWVRAEGVAGIAGFYVHVNGARPQLVNRVLDAGSGSYPWREVTAEFDIPEGGETITVGTVLYGTGRAWYDDVSLERLDPTGDAPRVEVGRAERRALVLQPGLTAWRPGAPGAWPVRIDARVRRMDEGGSATGMAAVDIRRALHLLRRVAGPQPHKPRVRAVDAVTGRAVACALVGDHACFEVAQPPWTERRFWVYLSPGGPSSAEEASLALARLAASPANLARDGTFEGAGADAAWPFAVEGGSAGAVETAIEPGGPGGGRCARLTVGPDAPLAWVGRRQLVRGIQPGALYLYAGQISTRGLREGSAALHAHLRTPAGDLVSESPYLSAGAGRTGDTPWTLLSTWFVAPGDCAAVELHLTVRARGTVKHDNVVLLRVRSAVVAAVASSRPEPAGLTAWFENPLVKLFPDDPPRTRTTASLIAARNEREPLVVGIRSGRALQRVVVRLTALRGPGGAVLPAADARRIVTVPVDRPSAYYVSRAPSWRRHTPVGAGVTDGWAGEWPDPLVPLEPFDLPARRTEAVRFEVRAPREARPGVYRGWVEVAASGTRLARLPVAVRVLGFTLPDRPSLRIVYDLRSGPGWIVEGAGEAMLRRWYRLLADHRVSSDTVHPAPVFAHADGRVTMDTTAFDAMARFTLDELGMAHLYTPWLFYALGWAHSPQPIFGLAPRTPAYEAAWREAYRLFVDHVTARGWRDRLTLYLSDEPHFPVPAVVEDLRYVAGLARAVAPDVPIFASTWRPAAGLEGHITKWGVGQYGGFPPDLIAARLQAGDRVWFTTDGQQALDTPYLATERLLPYYCLKYGVTGYEFWGVSWWTHNPWERGWHRFIRQTDDGATFYSVRYPNGDGYLAYPPLPGSEEPVPSIRLEAVRDGAEDYEYLAALQRLIGRARERGLDAREAQRALEGALSLVRIPNAGGLRSTEIMPDPDAVFYARVLVADAIERLRDALGDR
ncbi:MAG TPA: glycoside hydrolase domain-containing protein, partial [Chthonomonadales bacterium]|nr:glycoside hydrolase domain-containing protein [Chthonomonadales bacterium]